MQVGEHWIRKGIDGWRLDVAQEITTPGFWQEFRQRIKAINPEAYIVAEIWEDSRQWLGGDQFDAVMNYLWTAETLAFVGGDRVRLDQVEDRSYYPYPARSGVEFADKIDWLLGLYDWQIQLVQLNLLDSHDTARMISIVDGDVASVKLGTLLMCTFPGAPSIYYGDEIGLPGGRPDAMARRTFPWEHPERWDMDLLAYHKAAIALRHAHPALRVGSFERLYADADVYAFGRALDDERLVVAINVAEQPRDVAIPVSGAAAAELRFGTATAAVDGGSLRLALPARSGVVVALRPA
jgi:glycosidase